jgi:hypothetical protein
MTASITRLPVQRRPLRQERVARTVATIISALTAAAVAGWFR